jgi:dTDP-4-amino-4,6-dideoxygalactose transaminase
MPASTDTAGTPAPPRPLVEWLGFRKMLLLESGSAALSLVLEALAALGGGPGTGPGGASPAPRVRLPGLGCWTLTSAVRMTGARPRYYDLDRRMNPVGRTDPDPAVLIQPWGGTVRAGDRSPDGSPLVLDGTLSIFGSPPGEQAVERYRAAVISLGKAKPLGLPGGGGLLLVDDQDLHDEMRAALVHHYEDLSWTRQGCRYTPADRQAPALELQVDWLRSRHREHVAEVARVREAVSARTVLEPLAPPDGQDTPGVTAVVPFLLPADYPLSGREVHRIAMAERLPLLTHPVTPPYLEPAGADLDGDCPIAEDTARRLVLLPTTVAELGPPGALARLLDSAAAQPEAFRYPYALPAGGRSPLPEALRGPGILGRRLDGGFVYSHQFTRRTYQVSPAVAADLMAQPVPRG